MNLLPGIAGSGKIKKITWLLDLIEIQIHLEPFRNFLGAGGGWNDGTLTV